MFINKLLKIYNNKFSIISIYLNFMLKYKSSFLIIIF